MSIAEQLIQDFQEEAALTRKVLEAVPEKDFAWTPHPKSWPLAQLAGHLAEAPGWAGSSMMVPELDFAQAGGDWTPFVPETKEQLLEKHETTAAGFVEAVRGRDDAFMLETWTMRNGDTVMMQSPRHAALRSIGIHHTIHHRGQLLVYLRLRDVPLPPVYGPTADSPGAF